MRQLSTYRRSRWKSQARTEGTTRVMDERYGDLADEGLWEALYSAEAALLDGSIF